MRAFAFGTALAAVILAITAVSGCEEDSGPGDPLGEWPDSVKPIVGWFAAQTDYYEDSWAGLYYFDGSSVRSAATIGDTAFQSGTMASAQTAWATDRKTICRFAGSGWEALSPQPPCAEIDGESVAGAAVFDEGGSGYAACEEAQKMWRWDGGQWHQIQMSDWSPNYGVHLDCLGAKRCLAWNLGEMAFFDGKDFGGIELPGQLYSAGEAVLAANGDALALVYDPENEEVVRLLRYHSGQWARDDHLSEKENWLFSPVVARLGSFVALSDGPGDDEEGETVVLLDNHDVARPGWPRFHYMVFAPGGGGLAIDADDRVVYWLNGLEMTAIYELGEDEVPSGFLVAADAE